MQKTILVNSPTGLPRPKTVPVSSTAFEIGKNGSLLSKDDYYHETSEQWKPGERAIFDHTEDKTITESFENLRLEFVVEEAFSEVERSRKSIRRSSSLEWLLLEHERLIEYDELVNSVQKYPILSTTWWRSQTLK